ADYYHRVKIMLEAQLGMPPDELALALYVWQSVVEGLPDLRPPGFGEALWRWIEVAHVQLLSLGGPLGTERLSSAIGALFEDFFKLRDNVYDGARIAQLLHDSSPETLIVRLTEIDPKGLDRDYWLDSRPVVEALVDVQKAIRHWKKMSNAESD